jgi:hypothetical protein
LIEIVTREGKICAFHLQIANRVEALSEMIINQQGLLQPLIYLEPALASGSDVLMAEITVEGTTTSVARGAIFELTP